MGHQIIVQPDGRLCVWSSVVDAFIVMDASEDELIAWYADRAAARARDEAGRTIARVREGGPWAVYGPRGMRYNQALTEAQRRHGLDYDPREGCD